ncbi:hypothetical protein [Sulfurimonas sp.]|uniref:hypothetical protein n=1 Tax=Sulfurimonas sp. TaxID=2022749 RepID=UPI002B46EDBB|nr:hypothetical protein [Sulfurimonas sp.]
MYKLLVILSIFLTACQSVTTSSQIIHVFQRYQELNTQFLESIKSNNNEKKVKREQVENYMYKEYTQALNLLEKDYCSSPNEKVLNEFISTLTSTSNSAYEKPSFTLGIIYICQPNSIIENVKALNVVNKKYIVNTLSFGFKNASYNKEHEIKDYAELASKLDKLRVN